MTEQTYYAEALASWVKIESTARLFGYKKHEYIAEWLFNVYGIEETL